MIPHEYVFPSIAVAGGATAGVALVCLRRGTIKKLRVVQLSGTLDGFSYALYNTAAACQANGSALNGVDERLYRVTPLLSVVATKDAFASAEDYPEDGVSNLELAFACMDDHDGKPLKASPSSADNKLYLKLVVAGAGAKSFGVALTIMDPMI